MIKSIHPALKEIASLFNSRNRQVCLVGGAVRDALRGKKNSDWDAATDAGPEEASAIIRKAGGKAVPTGIRHGTITAFYKNFSVEITTFRTETGYSDGRRPDQVRYTATIEEDLSRRDFTMNAVALRLPSGEIIDPFGGARDIKAKIIRCVGNPAERFGEDGLRPLRAARFAAQLGFEIEQNALDAIPGALPVCAKVSKERVRDEIDKILASPLPSRAFLIMEKTGLLGLFLEELAACRGIGQKGFHRFDVLDHSLLACDYAARGGCSRELRLAALLHDIGKPLTREADENGVWTFYRHEETGAAMSRKMLNRLRYPNSVVDSVSGLVKEHMFHYTPDWTDSAVRRFIARIGESRLKDVYQLRRADAYGLCGKEIEPESLLELADRVEEVLARGRAFSIKDLAVSGKDLMAIGVPPGKIMGILLRELLETVLDDPEQNTKDKLLEIAGKMTGDAAPRYGDTLPSHGDAPPSHGGATPSHGGASPSHGDATPSHGGASPSRGDASPSHGDATPSRGDATPSHGDATPSRGDATPSHGDATPSHGDATPSHGDATPSHGGANHG